MLSHLGFSPERSGPAQDDLMNMTLRPVLQSGRAHEHTRGRVRPVLGGQSVVAVVGDYVVCGCIYEVFRASACPALLPNPRRNRVAP